MKEKIGEKIKEILKNKGLAPQYLIDCGINKNQVYGVLRMGNSHPDDYRISTLFKILEILDTDLIELLKLC